jgi:hypothetical protein
LNLSPFPGLSVDVLSLSNGLVDSGKRTPSTGSRKSESKLGLARKTATQVPSTPSRGTSKALGSHPKNGKTLGTQQPSRSFSHTRASTLLDSPSVPDPPLDVLVSPSRRCHNDSWTPQMPQEDIWHILGNRLFPTFMTLSTANTSSSADNSTISYGATKPPKSNESPKPIRRSVPTQRSTLTPQRGRKVQLNGISPENNGSKPSVLSDSFSVFQT